MIKKLEFFYDYVSPYSYLADSQLGKIGASEVVYRPMLLGAVMQATGNMPPGTIEAKGNYLRQDLARWAARYGVPYNRNPKFPQNTLKALRLAIVAEENDLFDKVHNALFEAMFIDEQNLEDDEILRGIMTAAGMDEVVTLARIAEQPVKDRLKANTDEAVARGAFGAPTFFVGKEMFFGNDRLQFIRDALR